MLRSGSISTFQQLASALAHKLTKKPFSGSVLLYDARLISPQHMSSRHLGKHPHGGVTRQFDWLVSYSLA